MHGYDTTRFAKCRRCNHGMIGILSFLARDICEPCGGHALNANNKKPMSLEELAAEIKRRRRNNSLLAHRPMPPPGKRRA